MYSENHCYLALLALQSTHTLTGHNSIPIEESSWTSLVKSDISMNSVHGFRSGSLLPGPCLVPALSPVQRRPPTPQHPSYVSQTGTPVLAPVNRQIGCHVENCQKNTQLHPRFENGGKARCQLQAAQRCIGSFKFHANTLMPICVHWFKRWPNL